MPTVNILNDPQTDKSKKSGRRVRYRRAREYVYGKRVGLSETHGNFRPRERRRDDPRETAQPVK